MFSSLFWGYICFYAPVQAKQNKLLPACPAAAFARATTPTVSQNTYAQGYFTFWAFCRWNILKDGRIANPRTGYRQQTFFCKAIWVKQTKKARTPGQCMKSISFRATFWASLSPLQAQGPVCSLGKPRWTLPGTPGASYQLLSRESERLPLPPPQPQWLCRSSRSKY